jgi:type II secretory pathway pseudopilin PulG
MNSRGTKNKQKKFKVATSLVEVLVVLAIISTTLISVTLLVVRAMESIKKDEIADDATGNLIKALEIVKAPSAIKVDNLQSLAALDNISKFSLESADGEYFLRYRSQDTLTLGNCDGNSPYFLSRTLGGTIEDKTVQCLELSIIPRNMGGGKVYYEIDSTLVYKSLNEFKMTSLKAYRYGKFSL